MLDYSFQAADLEYFLLIFVRVSCFVYVCPFFSMKNVPNRVKIAISFFIAFFVYSGLLAQNHILYDNVVEYAVIVVKEAIVGLLIGFSAYIATAVFAFAGHVADMEIGLSMVQLMDPNTKQNVTFTGALYNYGFTMILIATGMYRYLLGALVDTFTLIPINGAIFRSDKLLSAMVLFLSDYVVLSFRIIFPIFATVLMLNAILGVMAKLSPQMNMFAIGMQLKIITGLSVLFVCVGLMPQASEMIFSEMKKLMVLFVEAIY